ncbi:type II toxin-antitoxin system PemK/MazF family toxin [Desulfotignum phosphitoxidans]|uniref:type II toxin-antitoxin system PemK/MazF family toxin n=1 Tax=Desulfotignum phosphitoxidans TaxID=190898 RepID=UPI001F3CA769|nr:type II toxin-antitoxin system PemK/MazF family toxin [Desulfotignum phosphitoxidans]
MSPDKKRPVLILTRNSVLEYLGEVTVAPVTSTIREIPSEVFLSVDDGMPRDCAVNCDHLQTVSRGIGALITTLDSAKMGDVGRAIRFSLAI